ncbi:leucine rich repeat (LRR) protein [Allofrancisella inopinata]|uniref:Leucine rich repeat (LRR) protein n=1 Tax=Allofrancisella inopinata TaxID=1085647 RepID=A0AAE6YKA6_9GAMM|nr:hypothetical protein [Allofrancisella inopinata]QIV96409.1 hypothetical protein E4K63_06040 [Allofrancisella inopinata]TDT73392.1 leucine rich repeat (LRR) protein [Allofrancisella inopinata]
MRTDKEDSNDGSISQSIILDYNSLSGKGILENLKGEAEKSTITELNLSTCNIGNQAIKDISTNLKYLRVLDLSSCYINDQRLNVIAINLKHLKSLNISHCKYNIESGFIDHEITNLIPKLKNLKILGCTDVNYHNQISRHLASNFPLLLLNSSDCRNYFNKQYHIYSNQ